MRAQERIVTRDMHERKRLMFEHADAFVALPGGIGTLEELVEQLTWAQLGRHKKPILIANIDRFWDPLCALLDHMEKLQFIRAGLTVNLLVADRIEDVLPKLQAAARALPEDAMQAAASSGCEADAVASQPGWSASVIRDADPAFRLRSMRATTSTSATHAVAPDLTSL